MNSYRKYIRLVYCIAAFGICDARHSASAAIYTFDSLNTGVLTNQDGWVPYSNVSTLAMVVVPGTGYDTTKVASGLPPKIDPCAMRDWRRESAAELST